MTSFGTFLKFYNLIELFCNVDTAGQKLQSVLSCIQDCYKNI